jgi:sulfur carrier protein
MQILLNGETRELPAALSVLGLLDELELDPGRVAVELNRRILKRSEFERVTVTSGDRIEVVTFVGGG